MMTMAAATLSAIAQQPVDYVNPIIGTNGMGHTFPGACTPFGWVQLSPDTDTIPHNVNGAYQKNAYEYCAGYQYRDKTIVGFSHTHLSGTGHSDLGDILLMPAVGDVKLNPGRRIIRKRDTVHVLTMLQKKLFPDIMKWCWMIMALKPN